MAQKVVGLIKLQIPAGKATPAPPVGPALGQHGVNIMSFTKEFNERTQKDIGYIIPVVITVYADRSFTFVCKTPPAAVLLKKACNIKSGSGVPNKTKVATITKAQLEEIAKIKMPDLNANDVEAAQAKRKSLKEIGAEGKEAAATEASNKAGIAKKNAKAAAMQNSGSRLMSAIQGAQAANDAVSSGFDAAAARNTAMAQGINEADITNALNAAQNKANLASAAAKNKYDTASNIAATEKANADNSANRKSQLGNTILQAGLGWLTK